MCILFRFDQKNPHVRNFSARNSGAPILWAPGIFWFFLLENPRAHKIPRFRGGGGGSCFFGRGGGSANFVFMGVGIFPIRWCSKFFGFMSLTAQCERAIPFRDSIAEGVSHLFALFP